jgi:hypothetical protein
MMDVLAVMLVASLGGFLSGYGICSIIRDLRKAEVK